MKPESPARFVRISEAISYYSLLVLIALTAIPYGAAEAWWKALFQCAVFFLAGLCVVNSFFGKRETSYDYRLLLPPLILIGFAFLQTLPWSHQTIAGVDNIARTVSADPLQTRRFVSQFGALVLAGSLLVRHTNSQKRLRLLVELIIAVGAISASFGLFRQATQKNVGFILPYLRPGFGYAQFINPDHFAFLMEMALGLALGIAVCRGVSGRRLAAYLLACVPMWIALILANSRGAILSMLCQVIFLAWVFGSTHSSRWYAGEGDLRPSGVWLFRKIRSVAVRAILIMALLAAAVVTIIFIGGDPLARKLGAVSVELDQNTADAYTLRLNIWQATKELIKDHPIAGVGFGGYWIEITKYHHSSGAITPQEAHSDYLELLASGGLIGLAIGVWFVVEFARTVRRRLRIADRYDRAVTLGALGGTMTVAIHSLVDYGLHITINALVLTSLISIVAINVGDRKNRNEELVI